jgi:hypothetical protein
MERSWRIEYAGALYHVLSLVNQLQGIFLQDKEKEHKRKYEKFKSQIKV